MRSTLAALAACLLLTGCAPVWHLSYDPAEREARSAEKPLVIFYKDLQNLQSARLEDLLDQPEVAKHLSGKVLCKLIDEFPPDRKFVSQYGVTQAPALVIIHPDGTYHRHASGASLEEVVAFFAQSQPPGQQPMTTAQVPRTIDYAWEGIYEDALAKASRLNRELFIVYKWWLSPESTELLNVFLNRPEVARHFTNTVNCLLDMDYTPNRAIVRKYGVNSVPALILVHRDGTYHTRTGTMTAEEIISFATAARAPGSSRDGSTGLVDRLRTRTSATWYADYARAIAHARVRGTNLVVFFFSLFSDDSNRVARMLDRADVANMLNDTINCRLDFAQSENRHLMSSFGINRVPAMLVIRPDGTYHFREGPLDARGLADLLRAAEQPGQTPPAGGQGP
jgi:hypothetical protein